MERAPWAGELDTIIQKSIFDLSLLSGFGTNGGGFLRFSAALGALPSGPELSVSNDQLMLLDLGTDPPTRVPFDASHNDDDKTLIIWPLRPLRERTRHALVATTSLEDDAGLPLPASPLLARLVAGTDPPAGLESLVPRFQELTTKTGLAPESLAAAVVFTTHGDLDRVFAAVADVATRTYAWTQPPTCKPDGGLRSCEGTFTAQDYRHDSWVTGDASPPPGTLKVSGLAAPDQRRRGPLPHPGLRPRHQRHRGSGSKQPRRRRSARLRGHRGRCPGARRAPHRDPGDGRLNAMRFLGIDLANVRTTRSR
ncbi:MAG: hypothetical protein R3F39_05005 [Myxococcota bacterium]